MDLSETLLGISILLVAAVFIGIFAKRLRIPVTVVLAVGGFLIAWIAGPEAIPVLETLYGEGFAETVVAGSTRNARRPATIPVPTSKGALVAEGRPKVSATSV